MDNFVDERDYALLAQDKYTFSVLSRIIGGECELRLTDHERFILCFTGQPYPVWIWMPDDASEDEMESAFGVRPVKAVLGPDLLCIFDSEEQIRNMKPDQSKLADLPGRGQDVTAKGEDSDCVSRSFFPKLLVAEDPVCGSAHCQIGDYWSKELGKTGIHAYQASKRGGHLYCEMLDNGRIAISGEATLVAVSEIVVGD